VEDGKEMSEPVEVRCIIIGTESGITEDGLPIVDIVHERVHRGVTFECSKSFLDVGNNNSIAFLIRTGGKDVHFTFIVGSGGDALVKLYEDTVPTSNGTQVPLLNLFRRSTRIAETTVYHTPTVGGGSEGTNLIDLLNPGGSGPQAGGGTFRRETEWIFKPASVYYLLITNVSGNTKDMSIGIQFYEYDED
jgi:hypothetical protein